MRVVEKLLTIGVYLCVLSRPTSGFWMYRSAPEASGLETDVGTDDVPEQQPDNDAPEQIAPHRDLYSDSGNNYLDQDTDSHSENNDHKTSANDAALPVDKRNTDTAQENSDDSDTETDLENVNAMMDKTKQEDDHDDKYGEDSEELAITDEAKRNMSEGIKQNDIPNDSEINGVSDKGGGKRSPGTISEDFEDINFDANDQSNNSEGKRDLDIFEDDNDVDDNDDEYDASETISRRKRNAETNDNLENSDFLSINSRTINDEDGSEDDKIDDNLRNEKNIADEDEEDDTDDGDDQYYFRKRRSTDEDDVDDDDEGDDGNDDVDDDNDEDDDGYADDDIDDEEIINRRKRSVNEVEEDYLNDILSRKRRSMEINDDDDDDDDADDDDEYDIYDTRKRRYTFDDENDVDDAECSRLRRFLYRGDDSDENNMDDDDDDDDDMESRNPRDSCSDLDSCGDSLHEKDEKASKQENIQRKREANKVSLPVLDANNRKIREILAFSEQDDKPDEGYSSWTEWSECSSAC